ncbi:hypothetical protein RIF29_27427 [Crotalaria pallida]|uniref:Uncharacterized protein n=1 Tax=Crotalaria pallida TaxID=3830 RepID=A0AAN9EW92_CROPI
MVSQPSKLSNVDVRHRNNNRECDCSSCHSTIIDNPDNLATPSSICNVQPGKFALKFKSPICSDEKNQINMSGLISNQLSQNQSVLRDITNISHSRTQSATNLSQLYEANIDMGSANTKKRKRVPFSNQNINELYSIFSEGSPSSVSKLQLGSSLLKSRRANSDIDGNGLISHQLSQNRSVLSDITNISHSRTQSSINFSSFMKLILTWLQKT